VLTSIEIDDTKVDERHNLISGRIVNQPIGKLTEWSFNLALRLLHGGKRYEIYLQNDGTFAAMLETSGRVILVEGRNRAHQSARQFVSSATGKNYHVVPFRDACPR
jgi:hypothetical protein